jgi:hypothetical protein
MRLFVLALLFAAAAHADTAAPAGGPGKVIGRVTIAGLAPKLPTLPVTKDPRICGVNKPDEALVIGVGGGIKNAVVWLADMPAPMNLTKRNVRLEQQACRFEPHVAVALAGASVDVFNDDPVLHHPKATVGDEKQWDFPMPIKGYTVPRPLPKPEVIKVSCESHPWMKAYVVVLSSPASAVTDDTGNFSIEGVPPGKHKLKLWHERLGEREEEIDVPAGDTLQKDISLTPK